jgi:hypothetical protein
MLLPNLINLFSKCINTDTILLIIQKLRLSKSNHWVKSIICLALTDNWYLIANSSSLPVKKNAYGDSWED